MAQIHVDPVHRNDHNNFGRINHEICNKIAKNAVRDHHYGRLGDA